MVNIRLFGGVNVDRCVLATLLAAVGSVLLPPAVAFSPFSADPPRRLLSPVIPNGPVRLLADSLGLPLVTDPVLSWDEITELLAAFRPVQAAQAWDRHGRWITANPGALKADVEARFRAGADVDADTRERAAAVLDAYRARFLDALGQDAWLVQPAAAGPGHARDATQEEKDGWRQATLRHTVVASAFGLPSCVIPAAARPPEGLALTGPPGADHALLDAALAVTGSRAART